MTRAGATRALVVLASVLLFAATLAGYARLVLFDSEQFADRASATLADPSVRAEIGERVTDEIVLRNQADLLAVRPLIASAASSIAGGSAFRGLFRRAVLDAHRAIIHGDRNTLTLTLADAGTVVAAALEKLDPQLAADLDAGRRVVLLKHELGGFSADVIRLGDRLRVLGWLLAALALAAGIAALVLSRDRRRTDLAARARRRRRGRGDRRRLHGRARGDRQPATRRAGCGTPISATCARSAGCWPAPGAVVAAAAASLIKPVEIEGGLLAVWRVVVAEPAVRWVGLLRAASFVAAGVLLIARPLAALQIAVTLIGVYLLYKGLEAVLRMIYRPPAEDEAEAETPPAAPPAAGAAGGGRVGLGAADRGRGRRLRARRWHRGARRSRSRAATGRPRCATGRSTRSRCRRRTTRCRCPCRGGSRPSRSARSAASSRTGSAGC